MFIFLLLMYAAASRLTAAYGYDAGTDQAACGRPVRASRMMRPPCDLHHQSYCTSAGNTYPWQAVRRFIRENQGLMRRMYGDERHLSVLREDMQKRRKNVLWTEEDEDEDEEEGGAHESMDEGQRYRGSYDDYLVRERYGKQRQQDDVGNDIDDAVVTSARYLHDNNDDISTVLKTKFIYSEQPGKAVKIKDLNMPYFRQTTSTTQRSYIYTEPTVKEAPQPAPTIVENNITANISSEISNESNSTTSTNIYANVSKSAVDAEFSESNSTFSFTLDDVMDEDVKVDSGNVNKTQDDSTDAANGTATNTADYETITETTTLPQEEIQEKTKKPTGEILFQDMDTESTKNQNINYNKLRGVNACPVKEEVVAPFWANNTRGEVLALLNLYPFEQYVHWEKCTYEHRQMYCREGCRCEQQYRLHRLLAYDPNNECRGIFSDWFRFPSCCVCKCYDMPMEFRVTSRSPRKVNSERLKRSLANEDGANNNSA